MGGVKEYKQCVTQKATNVEYGIRQLELHIRGCPHSGDVSLAPQYLQVFLPEVRRDKHYSNVHFRPTHSSVQNLNQSSAYDDLELRNFVHRKFVQTGALQTDIEACVDEWHTAMGRRTKPMDIVNAPWYVRNTDFHRDLKMETVSAEIKRFLGKA